MTSHLHLHIVSIITWRCMSNLPFLERRVPVDATGALTALEASVADRLLVPTRNLRASTRIARRTLLRRSRAARSSLHFQAQLTRKRLTDVRVLRREQKSAESTLAFRRVVTPKFSEYTEAPSSRPVRQRFTDLFGVDFLKHSEMLDYHDAEIGRVLHSTPFHALQAKPQVGPSESSEASRKKNLNDAPLGMIASGLINSLPLKVYVLVDIQYPI